MLDTRIEDQLRQALRGEAEEMPFSITLEDLNRRRGERRHSLSAWSVAGMAAVLAISIAAAAAIVMSGPPSSGVVGGTPGLSVEPSVAPSPSVASLPSVDEMRAHVDPRAGILAAARRSGDSGTVPDDRPAWDVGRIGRNTGFELVLACIGSAPMTVVFVDTSTAEAPPLASFDVPCTGEVGIHEQYAPLAAAPSNVQIRVQAGRDIAWHVVALVRPDAPAPSPSGTPDVSPASSPTAAPPPTGPVGEIEPYPGWSHVTGVSAGYDGGDDAGQSNVHRFTVPDEAPVLLVSTACAGDGTVTWSLPGEYGGTTREVVCPSSSRDPIRMHVLDFNGPETEMSVTVTGRVSYEIRIEGNDALIDLPRIVLAGDGGTAEMLNGCGIDMTMSWGSPGSDQCMTTLPNEPLEQLEIFAGETARVSLAGWTVTDATAECGRLSPTDPAVFEPLAECAIGVGWDDDEIGLIRLERGGNPWLVELRISARNGMGDSFTGPYYAYVLVR